ncbi:MAG TPA: DUF937 domain-containing protein [Candidatus Angelobacter sp.]|nr:DUF937 domain-containing protein [Candidatus Angelobacter sp.]
MAELTDTLEQLLDQQSGQIGSRIGADETKTRSAIHAAVPALMAAFSQEAERGGGIQDAIRKDHDGSIIDQLSEYLGGQAQLSPRTTNGAGILSHVLGDRQPQMQQALSAKTGLDAGSIGQLLALLAPVVMGMIGKKSNASPGGGFDLNDLGSILGREKADAKSKNPDLGDLLDGFTGGKGGIGGALGDLLGGRDR